MAKVTELNHVWTETRRACRSQLIESLASHGCRKLNALSLFAALRLQGIENEAAHRQTSQHLGHNRIRDAKVSNVPLQDHREEMNEEQSVNSYDTLINPKVSAGDLSDPQAGIPKQPQLQIARPI